MSKRDSPEALELPLYDLPLRDAGGTTELEGAGDLSLKSDRQTPRTPAVADPDRTYVESPPRRGSSSQDEHPAEGGRGEYGHGGEELPASVRDRWLAGLLDLGIQLLILSAAVAAVRWMNVTLSLDDWLPFAALGLIFSFLYWFIPLAFWGQTPGMAWVGNAAMSLSEEPLTFGQSVLRWIGALITLTLAGLPLFLALGEGSRSLTDRLSYSKTVVLAP